MNSQEGRHVPARPQRRGIPPFDRFPTQAASFRMIPCGSLRNESACLRPSSPFSGRTTQWRGMGQVTSDGGGNGKSWLS
jgi:hypothetical protein